jgi:hypothetical protein
VNLVEVLCLQPLCLMNSPSSPSSEEDPLKKKSFGHGIPTWSPYATANQSRLWLHEDSNQGVGMRKGDLPWGKLADGTVDCSITGSISPISASRSPLVKMERRAATLRAKKAARLERTARRKKGLVEATGESGDIDWNCVLDAVADSMLTKPGITPACDVDRESRPHSLSRARTKKGQGEPKYKCTPCVEKRWQKKVVRRPQSASYKSRTEVEARCMKSCLELTRKQIRLAENARTSNLPTNVMALDQLYHKVDALERGTVRSALRAVTAAISDRQRKEAQLNTAPGTLRAGRPLSGLLDLRISGRVVTSPIQQLQEHEKLRRHRPAN